MFLSFNSHAEWTQVEENADGSSSYVDFSSIRKTGNSSRIWVLFDFKVPEGDSINEKYLSAKSLGEYDCKAEKYRVLTYTTFKGNMGSGSIVNGSEPDQRWQYVSPQSKAEYFYKLACKKK